MRFKVVGSLPGLSMLGTALMVFLLACGGETDPAPPAAEEGAQGEASEAEGESGEAQTAEPEDLSKVRTLVSVGLEFDLPDGWLAEHRGNLARSAQATIPGETGDAALSVFHFPAGGTGKEANLQRWTDQVDPLPGMEPQRESFEVGDYQVTWIDVRGTTKASRNADPPVTEPNYRIFGAVVEGDGGPWFFRVGGPDATLGGHRQGFVQMMQSVRKGGIRSVVR